jgi:hypothetical protein
VIIAAIRRWTLARLLVFCAAWVVVSFVALVAYSFASMTWAVDVGQGSGGIGAVSVGIVPALFVLICLFPPTVAVVIWAVGRGRRETPLSGQHRSRDE